MTDLKNVVLRHSKVGKRGVILYKIVDEESDIEELRFAPDFYDDWAQRFFQGSSGWMKSVGYCMLGGIRVRVLAGQNLRTHGKKKSKESSPHTFCKLFVGDIPLGMSSVQKDTGNPRWAYDTELHFMCNIRSPEIRVEVYSQSTVSNAYLGSCVVPLVDGNELISIPHEQWVKLVDKDHCEYDTAGQVKIRIEFIGKSITAPITRDNLLYANEAGISHYKHSGRCVKDVITELHGKSIWYQMDELYLNEMTNLKLGRKDPHAPERIVAYFPADEATAFDTPCHYLLTSSRMVLLMDRVGMNHGCLMSSKPSMAAMRPQIFSVPIASIRSYSVTLTEDRRGSSVLAITFQLTGMRKLTIELVCLFFSLFLFFSFSISPHSHTHTHTHHRDPWMNMLRRVTRQKKHLQEF